MGKNTSDSIISISTSDIEPDNPLDKKCAAGIEYDAGSCIPLNLLIAVAEIYNKEYPDKTIKLYPNQEILNPRKYKKYLVFSLKDRFKNNSQRTWVNKSFINKLKELDRIQLENYTFRPEGPQGKFEWLNTLHIDDVMGQYELKYPDFKYFGTVPIDFDDFDRFNIRNINYSKLVKDGKTKYGVIFNLDKHNESGSHWVAMFADVKKGHIFFFDSYGIPPHKNIAKLMRRIAKFGQEKMGIKEQRVDYNKIQHQFENSECGVYSINFILRLLRGDTFEEICKSKIPDKKINKCRNVYFNNVNIK